MAVLTIRQSDKLGCNQKKKKEKKVFEILSTPRAAVNHWEPHIALESVTYAKGGLNFAMKSLQAFLHSYFSVSTFLII